MYNIQFFVVQWFDIYTYRTSMIDSVVPANSRIVTWCPVHMGRSWFFVGGLITQIFIRGAESTTTTICNKYTQTAFPAAFVQRRLPIISSIEIKSTNLKTLVFILESVHISMKAKRRKVIYLKALCHSKFWHATVALLQ